MGKLLITVKVRGTIGLDAMRISLAKQIPFAVAYVQSTADANAMLCSLVGKLVAMEPAVRDIQFSIPELGYRWEAYTESTSL